MLRDADVPAAMEIDKPAAAAPAAPAAAAAAAASAPARPRRTSSSVSRRNDEFMDWWITQENITPEYRWNKESRNLLEGAAMRHNTGGFTSDQGTGKTDQSYCGNASSGENGGPGIRLVISH
jgi:hypothetical protein